MQAGTISPRVFILASVAFALVGLVTIALIVVGYQELQPSSQYLGIEGMAEVLLILGIYFLIPYVFVMLCGIVMKFRWGDTLTETESTKLWLTAMNLTLLLAFLIQQVFTDMYLTRYRGVEYVAVFLIFDVVIPFVYANKHFHHTTVPTYLYTAVYMVKLALMWDVVQLMDPNDPAWVYGPNGMRVMLFLSIPIVQLPVYISLIEKGQNVMQAFTRQMNAVLGHLLHSLDIFTFFELSFSPNAVPSSVFELNCALTCVAFLANNVCFASLFHKTQKFEEFSKTIDSSAPYERMDDAWKTERTNIELRVLTYLLVLTFFVDLPFLISRVVMWYLDNVQLTLFIAKDGKNLIEVTMLIVRNAHFTEALRERVAWWESQSR
eukprot:PhF_6_TR31287/c0_g1_i1/m.45844